ncbi:MAG: hypothetical protein M3O64_00625 [Chloroflexota bacterium]|nr:hypothetical protein [Chloroflexota bacterium]
MTRLSGLMEDLGRIVGQWARPALASLGPRQVRYAIVLAMVTARFS